MSTYTNRLREISEQSTSLSSVPYREACDLLKQADAEIERLRSVLRRLREVLRRPGGYLNHEHEVWGILRDADACLPPPR